ncbi:MAG: chlorite dismutase family protein [Verrucomicrobiota bacterium]|nr:chlorite dismutase family protein [Verrucomicrobiota bacterium]
MLHSSSFMPPIKSFPWHQGATLNTLLTVNTSATTSPTQNQTLRLFSFAGATSGEWKVLSIKTLIGDPLPSVTHLTIAPPAIPPTGSTVLWTLRGITSNERYVTRSEKEQLLNRQPPTGRSEATHAALIPIRKTDDWWRLPQDERRRIFEEQSHHIEIGLLFLPAIARRLHHCRDLSPHEPFDFLTWFEFAPSDASAFDDLIDKLRATSEWNFVSREIEIRLERNQTSALS